MPCPSFSRLTAVYKMTSNRLSKSPAALSSRWRGSDHFLLFRGENYASENRHWGTSKPVCFRRSSDAGTIRRQCRWRNVPDTGAGRLHVRELLPPVHFRPQTDQQHPAKEEQIAYRQPAIIGHLPVRRYDIMGLHSAS